MKNFLFFLSLFLLIGCSDEHAEYEEINEPINFVKPANFPELAYNFPNNPLTEKGFELGKKLFFDGRLSRTNIVSCNFCHEQPYAFTHHGHNLSHGVDDLIGIRNAPAVQNMAFQSEYFYDGASNNLEMLSIVPIHNPVEMDENLPSIINKIKGDVSYQKLFRQAFTDGQINSTNMLKALAQYMTMLVSSNSKYDKYVRGEAGGNLTALELQGKQLFENKCRVCHSTDIFTDNSFRNTGVQPNPMINDKGREEVSGNSNDRYKFKVPSLRNVELTAPYLHDGRLGSLEAVLDFYSNGVQDSSTLDPILKQNGVLGIPLNNQEKQALTAFLKTLTDHEFVTNPKFDFRN
jgi:cytochrome c peroxidase